MVNRLWLSRRKCCLRSVWTISKALVFGMLSSTLISEIVIPSGCVASRLRISVARSVLRLSGIYPPEVLETEHNGITVHIIVKKACISSHKFVYPNIKSNIQNYLTCFRDSTSRIPKSRPDFMLNVFTVMRSIGAVRERFSGSL